MSSPTRFCSKCNSEVGRWRACPASGCGFESVFCNKCGGDDQALFEMARHIATEHGGVDHNGSVKKG